ncbi:MAG: hypothetical protein HY603_01195 [Parcubacteria group bacterium]|nr:hypothetical protein [Parcubacteria group bacterium]MBI4217399.1 hypothetical protein [Parcubacteria group bacterium]
MSDEWESRFFVLGVVTLGLWAFFEKALPLWGYNISLGAFVSAAFGLQ